MQYIFRFLPQSHQICHHLGKYNSFHCGVFRVHQGEQRWLCMAAALQCTGGKMGMGQGVQN